MPESFRIAVPKKYLVRAAVDVVLYDTVAEVRQAYQECTGKPDSVGQAFCQPVHEIELKSGRKTQTIAVLHLARSRCSLHILTHEVAHAMFAWLMDGQRWVEIFTNQDQATGTEERACDLLGALLTGLVDALQRRALPVLAV